MGTWSYICNNGQGCGAVATREAMSWKDAHKEVDGLAIAAYLDCNGVGSDSNAPTSAMLSVLDVLQRCRDDLGAVRESVRAMRALADGYGTQLQVYEGGPALVQSSAIHGGGSLLPLTRLLVASNRHPDMEEVYSSYLEMFAAEGLMTATRPFMQFSSTALPGKYGSWGLLEFTGQPPASAPKYMAIQKAINISSPWIEGGCMAPDGRNAWLADSTFVGLPAVTEPSFGEVWISGKQHVVSWNTLGAPAGQLVSIRLWKATNCGPDAGPVAVLARGIPSSGRFTYTVPMSIPPGNDFFVEIFSRGSHNYSRQAKATLPCTLLTGFSATFPRCVSSLTVFDLAQLLLCRGPIPILNWGLGDLLQAVWSWHAKPGVDMPDQSEACRAAQNAI